MEPRAEDQSAEANKKGEPEQDPVLQHDCVIRLNIQTLFGRSADIIAVELVEAIDKLFEQRGVESQPKQLIAVAGRYRGRVRLYYVELSFYILEDAANGAATIQQVVETVHDIQGSHRSVKDAVIDVSTAPPAPPVASLFEVLTNLVLTGGLRKEGEPTSEGA